MEGSTSLALLAQIQLNLLNTLTPQRPSRRDKAPHTDSKEAQLTDEDRVELEVRPPPARST